MSEQICIGPLSRVVLPPMSDTALCEVCNKWFEWFPKNAGSEVKEVP